MAILSVNDNDECEYTCRAENSVGEKACSANLHLIETPAGSKPQPYVASSFSLEKLVFVVIIEPKMLLHHSFVNFVIAQFSKDNVRNSIVSSLVNQVQQYVGYSMVHH